MTWVIQCDTCGTTEAIPNAPEKRDTNRGLMVPDAWTVRPIARGYEHVCPDCSRPDPTASGNRQAPGVRT